MSIQTECPHCHTLFRVTQSQLDQADGQVRCGHCLAIFTVENPYQTDHDIGITAQRDEPVQLEQMDPLHSNDTGKHVLPDVIPPELRAESRNRKRDYSVIGTLFWSMAIVLMIVTGLLQYAYYDRSRLVQYDNLRPWLTLFCKYARCELPEPRDPARIELSSKNVYTHPNAENALMVSATMINHASYVQAFPLLELRFENIRGELIAGRQFKPEEYLDIPAEKIQKMQPGTPVSFTMEIVDPGKDVMSYEFKFL